MVRDAWLPLICGVLACVFVWWGTGHLQWRAEIDSPTRTVNRLVAAISAPPRVAGVGNPHATGPATARQDALALLDLPGMSRKTLGPHWNKLNPSEQEAFTTLLTQLLVHIAFPQSAAFFQDLAVTVRGEHIRGHNATVNTYVEHPTEGQIDIDYRLIRRESGWLIRDIHLDGVSLSRNLRAQFQQIIRHDSYAALLRRMREKLAHATASAS